MFSAVCFVIITIWHRCTIILQWYIYERSLHGFIILRQLQIINEKLDDLCNFFWSQYVIVNLLDFCYAVHRADAQRNVFPLRCISQRCAGGLYLACRKSRWMPDQWRETNTMYDKKDDSPEMKRRERFRRPSQQQSPVVATKRALLMLLVCLLCLICVRMILR